MDDVQVICNAHGPMHYRFAFDWWECVGFDGEGCSGQIVYAEDLDRGGNIPGVTIRAAA